MTDDDRCPVIIDGVRCAWPPHPGNVHNTSDVIPTTVRTPTPNELRAAHPELDTSPAARLGRALGWVGVSTVVIMCTLASAALVAVAFWFVGELWHWAWTSWS